MPVGRAYLQIDPLESRYLLSVTPANLTALIVNQTYGLDQTTTTANSVAGDDSGDFVVAWSRLDNVLNAAGNPIINPATSGPYQVSNVYARYFTDTVEQISLPGAGTSNNNGVYLPNGIATNFDNDANTVGHFSLSYNDETVQQISITAGTEPSGDAAADANIAASANIAGEFTLYLNATGNDAVGQNDPTVGGGTQSDLLNVFYDETNPTLAASQIQAWLRNFAPVAANATTGFFGSDATHATVNTIDPHTFVVDYGAATRGLNQSSLLQYLSPSSTLSPISTTQHVLTFTATGALPLTGSFRLKVGSVLTQSINFDSTSAATLATTAANMQTALMNAGFTGTTVSVDTATNPFSFNVTFLNPEPVVQYVAASPAMAVTFADSASTETAGELSNFNLSGFLPAVQMTTLDQPFTVSNIPVSQTDPMLTAQAIENYFEQAATTFATAVAPFDFPAPNSINVNTTEAPYTAPVYVNTSLNTTAVPVTGVTPSITVVPVMTSNGTYSYTQFDVTFNGINGAADIAPMVVSNVADENGVGIGVNTTQKVDNTVTLTTGSTESQVQILKQSGNEFQVNPPQPTSIYTSTTQPLNSDQPSVAMDGSGNFVTTALALAQSIGSRLAKAAVVATVDGREVDLESPLPDGAEVAIVTADSDAGREVLRHSTAHVMAQAVRRLWPGAKYAIGPVIENGFYYDFELPDGAHFSDDDLERIDAEMRDIIEEDQPFVRHEHTLEEGLEIFADQPFKQEIIEAVGAGADEVDAAGSVVSTYWNSDAFIDLCRGPHVPSTGRLGHFKLMRVAGAYWRGDEKREQLQRIYGTAWESEKALAAHLHQLEEAERRDHRKLGAELDLFSFPEEIGSGLAVFHPKGGTIRRLMEEYSRQRHVESGYDFVNSPHITKSALFEESGHLDWFAEGMYPPMELDGGHAVLPQADELPVPHPRVQEPPALLPRAADAALRVRHGLPLREVGRAAGPDPGPGHDPGRRAHLLHPRADGRRAGPHAALRPRPAARLRAQRVLPRAVDQAAGQGRRLRRGVGGGHRGAAHHGPRRWASSSSWTRAAAPSTAPRSRSRPATPSAGPGRCRRCSSTSSCPSASGWSTSARTTSATGRS